MEMIPAKSILIRNKTTSWFGSEYNMNIYRGCPHGCIYCDSRSDCYHVEDFGRVRAKENALALLRDELSRKAKPIMVATGAMSDPYNPFEKDTLLTRHSLQLLDAYGMGVAVATKSDLIARDGDVLEDIQAQAPVICKITITCHDDALAAKLEPGAPSPTRRFQALASLAGRGLFCGVLLMPVLPFLQDSEENIRTILHRAASCGARFVFPTFGLTMRAGQREYFYAGLEKAFPGEGLPQRYAQKYGGNYFCGSPRQKQLWAAFTSICKETGLLYDMREIVRASRQGRQTGQLSFL